MCISLIGVCGENKLKFPIKKRMVHNFNDDVWKFMVGATRCSIRSSNSSNKDVREAEYIKMM